MNLDLGVLRSALNANKLSVAHSQGKLPAGVGGVVTAAAEGGGAWGLVEMEKEGLGRRTEFVRLLEVPSGIEQKPWKLG